MVWYEKRKNRTRTTDILQKWNGMAEYPKNLTAVVDNRMVTFDTFFGASVKSDLSRYIMKA